MSKSRFVTRASYIWAAMHAVSIEESRYYLQGVQVRPRNKGGLILTATDGHILSLRRDPEGAWCSAAQDFIFKPSKSLLAKMKGKHSRFTSENPFIVVEWEKSGGMVTATVIASDNAQDALNLEGDIEHQEIGRFSVEGSFPDAARVLPREMPEGPQALQSFNHELIMRLFHASGASIRKETPFVEIYQNKYGEPAVIKCGYRENDGMWTGVIMPARESGKAPNMLEVVGELETVEPARMAAE